MDILNSVNRNHNPGFVRHTITSSIVNNVHELDKKYLLTNNVHVSKGSMSERNLLFTNKYPPDIIQAACLYGNITETPRRVRHRPHLFVLDELKLQE